MVHFQQSIAETGATARSRRTQHTESTMRRAVETAASAETLIRLSGNTAPYGPSPAAIAAIRDVADRVHLYPDRQSDNLAQVFGDIEGVDPSEVAPTAGSAGAILDLVRQSTRGAGKVVAFDQAFHLYAQAASFAGVEYDTVPVGSSFERDIEAFLDHVDDGTGVAIIDNPPNPTSDTLKPEELVWLLTRIPDDTLVILDEAYHDFADGHRGYDSMMHHREVHERLVVTRTMSKAFGLAGQRIGYGMGPAEIMAPSRSNASLSASPRRRRLRRSPPSPTRITPRATSPRPRRQKSAWWSCFANRASPC